MVLQMGFHFSLPILII